MHINQETGEHIQRNIIVFSMHNCFDIDTIHDRSIHTDMNAKVLHCVESERREEGSQHHSCDADHSKGKSNIASVPALPWTIPSASG